jgi:UDP-N-acetyl-D-glucosamine dehydrogenase
MREHAFDLASVALSESSLREYDCVVIGTDHRKVDYELVKAWSQLVVDARGVYRAPAANIIRA